ncbi:MAG: phosphoglucosamine mutase [Flavobacteriales bacterium]|nr:phosphoglucosamine mutase [Flavobacteriales bacterium]MBQ5815510.1 phosphoglucosamine mutase [Flavobacteriales bacterium]
MALIKSISGFRGTIGGEVGDNLTPLDAVKFASAYATWLKSENKGKEERLKVVVGRDARISGQMVQSLVVASLQGMGVDVIDLGLSTTPTVELMVTHFAADGGIILTASHNPKEWNALKLLTSEGEFLDAAQGGEVLRIAAADEYVYADVDSLGEVTYFDKSIEEHVKKVLDLKLVDKEAIAAADFEVVVDGINSTGGMAIPAMLEALGVKKVKVLNGEANGHFAHNPEPLKENLTGIASVIAEEGADMGIVVDPDVDRLAFMDETGEMFGEEYTLVAVADYVLSHTPGSTVSNMSSSRALADVAAAHGCTYEASAVGEVNVVTLMKKNGCVIGGEGNGGVIYPESHYGRDALVGVALFLSHLAHKKIKMSELKKELPAYFMSKAKVSLTPEIDVDLILSKMKEKYATERVSDIDGVKIDFAESWVHLRKSNTEPIIRIYTEAKTQQEADQLGCDIMEVIKSLC